MANTKNGTVKWFNVGKGYGFVTPDDGGKDIFVHVNVLPEELKGADGQFPSNVLPEGSQVQVEVTKGKKGPQAESLKLLARASPQVKDKKPTGGAERETQKKPRGTREKRSKRTSSIKVVPLGPRDSQGWHAFRVELFDDEGRPSEEEVSVQVNPHRDLELDSASSDPHETTRGITLVVQGTWTGELRIREGSGLKELNITLTRDDNNETARMLLLSSDFWAKT